MELSLLLGLVIAVDLLLSFRFHVWQNIFFVDTLLSISLFHF